MAIFGKPSALRMVYIELIRYFSWGLVHLVHLVHFVYVECVWCSFHYSKCWSDLFRVEGEDTWILDSPFYINSSKCLTWISRFHCVSSAFVAGTFGVHSGMNAEHLFEHWNPYIGIIYTRYIIPIWFHPYDPVYPIERILWEYNAQTNNLARAIDCANLLWTLFFPERCFWFSFTFHLTIDFQSYNAQRVTPT